MDRIKTRQQKFKRGKEKMLSLAQVSVDEPKLIPPDQNNDEDDDDGMMYITTARECN